MTIFKILINNNEYVFETNVRPVHKAIVEMRKWIWNNFDRKQRFHCYDIRTKNE